MEREGQSKLGIAALIISIFTAIGLFILFLIAGVMESNTYGGIDEESAGAIIVGLFIFGFGFYLSGISWITNSLTFDDNFKILIQSIIIIILSNKKPIRKFFCLDV